MPCLGVIDYSPITSSVTFISLPVLSGTTRCASFLLRDDATVEDVETFTVAITDPGGAVLEFPSSATVTINDNERK